jgi:hypothetical protein
MKKPFSAFYYVFGCLTLGLSLIQIFMHKHYIFIIPAILGLIIGVIGRIGIKNPQ